MTVIRRVEIRGTAQQLPLRASSGTLGIILSLKLSTRRHGCTPLIFELVINEVTTEMFAKISITHPPKINNGNCGGDRPEEDHYTISGHWRQVEEINKNPLDCLGTVDLPNRWLTIGILTKDVYVQQAPHQHHVRS